ncbi:MAG: protein BatD [Chloroflexi bacterium]|nr:protein BatD [Chloroflexota bacterium]
MNKIPLLQKISLASALAVILICSQVSSVLAQTDSQSEQWGNLVITRTAPQLAQVGQQSWVVIQIENIGSDELEFRLFEKLGEADFDQSQAKATKIFDPGYDAVPPAEGQEGFNLWYYEWHIRLAAGQTTAMAYWLTPRQPGLYVIPPAQIVMGEEVYTTSSWAITVQCVVDGLCNITEGENYLTCPDDCPSGAQDFICDGALDGQIDPDCEAGFDLDETTVSTPQPSLTPTSPETPGPPRPCLGSIAVLLFVPAIVLTIRYRMRRRELA